MSNDFYAISNGWTIRGDGQYLYVSRDGKPGEIHIKAENEGFVVDIWPDDGDCPDATLSSFYTDLEPDEEGEQPIAWPRR